MVSGMPGSRCLLWQENRIFKRMGKSMQEKNVISGNILVLAIAVLVCLAGAARATSTEQVLYSFGPFPDGASPEAGLVFDGAGNLYGTTYNGGTHDVGTVFELLPRAGGGWNETVLYSFTGGADGGRPVSTITLDGSGHLYGTTQFGGTGSGVVFELSQSGGSWTGKVLHTFGSGTDGKQPLGGVIFDGFGNLIGTTSVGGAKNDGIIFELTPSKTGWSETVIHAFTGGNDDSSPVGKLTKDHLGRIYGTTRGGVGSIYRLTRGTAGHWLYQQLYCFCNGGGVSPYGGLAVDSLFRIYGTTFGGFGNGNVFQLAFDGRKFVPNQIYKFKGKSDGSNPQGGVVLDAEGNLYGTTAFGGDHGLGVVFKVTRQGGGWVETPIHSFGGASHSDGADPVTDLIFDVAGNLYGTTYSGGDVNGGVVFEVTP